MSSPTLLTLPPEIRELIYTHLFAPKEFKINAAPSPYPDGPLPGYRFDLRPLRTSRQIYAEARRVFRRLNVFAAIETPWPEAETHVHVEGHVPLAVRGEAALRFRAAHLRVQISFSHLAADDAPPQRFVVLRDDLPAFCQVWHYSDLGNPGLNPHLRLRLQLRDPYGEEGDPVPAALQRQLLEPFGRVKDLDKVVVAGAPDAAAEKAMRAAMAQPVPSAETCLEEGTRLKDDGNRALQEGRYGDALALYERAFLAIHIVCEGRRRTVWADRFFARELRAPPFAGEHGLMARALLRARLVANVVLAHLRRRDFAEAHFWGERTIRLIQGGGAAGPDAQGPDFPASKEFGKIYYRTALAAKELGDKSEARSYLAVAVKYLPRDPIVRKELESLALPLM